MSIRVIAKKGIWVLQKYAPEILTYGGLITMVGGTVLACKQTPKAVEIINETKGNLESIRKVNEEAEANGGQYARVNEDGTATMISYSKQDYQKDLAIQHTNNVKSLAKTYALPAVLVFGGAACVLGGHGILRKRNAVAIATLGSVLEGFRKYRGNVIADLGEEADRKYRFGLPAAKTIETVNADTGEVTKEEVQPRGVLGLPEGDPRGLMFNKATCPQFYKGNLLADLTTIKGIQGLCNNLLSIYGHLTVNTVRREFGAKAIPEGLDNGWVIDGPNSDMHVDFGIFDPVTGEPKAWVFDLVDEDQGIPIEFNIDGNIKGLIARPRNCRN